MDQKPCYMKTRLRIYEKAFILIGYGKGIGIYSIYQSVFVFCVF